MSKKRVAQYGLMVAMSAITSAGVGLLTFKLVHGLCALWSRGGEACVTSGRLEPFLVMHAHLVAVLVAAFLFFIISCRIARVTEPRMLALGMFIYVCISWLAAESNWGSPRDAMVVLFAGAGALLYLLWRRESPNNALQATRENARA